MKEKKENGFTKKSGDMIYNFKRNFMTNDTRTILIILILIAIFLVINLWVRSLNLVQIDVTKEKLYTLTDISKDNLKNLNKDVYIYIWGFESSPTTIDLLKQYNAVNSKIKFEVVTRESNPNAVKRYEFDDDYPEIVLTVDEGTKNEKIETLYSADLVSMDSNFNAVDATEQRITNSILRLQSDDTKVIYYLAGGEFQVANDSSMSVFKSLVDESYIYELEALETTNPKKFKVPKDCSILILPTIIDDLHSSVSKQIINYINDGGNIIIMNNAYYEKKGNTPNYQAILDLYGIKLESNQVLESKNYRLTETSSYINGNYSYTHPVTKYQAYKPVLYKPGAIEFKDAGSLALLRVTYDVILVSSDEAALTYYKTKKENADGNYIIGASLTKVIKDGVISKAVVYATQSSFSDMSAKELGYEDVALANIPGNAGILMNSVSYLGNEDYYPILKNNTSLVTTLNNIPSENQDYIIRTIIAGIPVVIALLGVFIIARRNRKQNK